MADETSNQAQEAAPKTEPQLLAEMQAAVASGDFKAVAKVAAELVKVQKSKEAAELEAKVKALEAITGTVKAAIVKALKPMIEAGKMDSADGVWFTWDFGEGDLVGCKLMKSQAKTARTGGGGGGGGKKFNVSTKELIDQKYAKEAYKDGMTFKEAWDKSSDKNWRFAIRNAVLKLEGLIS